MDRKLVATVVVVLTFSIMAVSSANAQRRGFLGDLEEWAKRNVKDTVVRGVAVEALGGDALARSFDEVEWWNDLEFVPRTLEVGGKTYKHVRMGNSNMLDTGSGWHGRLNCDNWYLGAALSGTSLKEERRVSCDRIEHQIIQKHIEHDVYYHGTDGKTASEVRVNRIMWFEAHPHSYYSRNDMQMRRRPNGIIIRIPKQWLTGSIDGVGTSVVGPQVMDKVLDSSVHARDYLIDNHHGSSIQVYLPLSSYEMEKILPSGLTDQRADAYDTIYWTVHRVSLDTSYTPIYRYEITVDRIELGLGNAKDRQPPVVAWNNGDPLKDY